MNINFPATRKRVYCVEYRVPATLEEPLVLDKIRKAMLSIGYANAEVSPQTMTKEKVNYETFKYDAQSKLADGDFCYWIYRLECRYGSGR